MDAPKAHRLGEKLWGGFSKPALHDLEALCRSTTASKIERRAAAWYLAEWHHCKKDARSTLAWLEFANLLDPEWPLEKSGLLLQICNHLELENFTEADRLMSDGVLRYGHHADLNLLASNALAGKAARRQNARVSDDARLELINRMYAAAGLHTIRKAASSGRLTLDNIASAPSGMEQRTAGPTISVIVPAFNAENTIRFALSGLLEQSWKNIEIIVVDDGSTDGTCALVERAAAIDRRVKLVRSNQNSGPYVARNLGLKHATGEFITVQDSDDWSHSQKLEKQIEALLGSGAVAGMSAWLRVTMDLQVHHLWRAKNRFTHANHSSLLLHRETVEGLGGWDPVRFHADNEFVYRVISKYGRKSIHRMREIPLSLGLIRSNSLTGHDTSHISSLAFGARQEYRRAFTRWHASVHDEGSYRLDVPPRSRRRFPAPATMLPLADVNSPYDVIFAGDLALSSELLAPLHQSVAEALEKGLRIGVFHWPRYDLDIDREIEEGLAQLIDEFRIDMLVARQVATTDDLVFFDPTGLQYQIDGVPRVVYQNLYVIDDDAGRIGSGCGMPFDPLLVSKNLEDLVGSSGERIATFSVCFRRRPSKQPDATRR